MVILDYLRALLFDWRKKRAISEARRSADLYRKKFLVLVYQGRPVCVSMQGVKQLIRQKRFPGLTAERRARLPFMKQPPNPHAHVPDC